MNIVSLVAEHKNPLIDPKPLLSCELVLPVLDNIIGRDENVLQHLTFPNSWRYEGNTVLNYFMRRCNEMFRRRNITCTQCDTSVEQHHCAWFTLTGRRYGVQRFTCYNCMTHYCNDCDDEDGKHILRYCDICEKYYCRACVSTEECVSCNECYCKECKSLEECGECNDKCCSKCIAKCGGASVGLQCDVKVCKSCAGGRRCNKCSILLCDFCWEFRGGCGHCGNCQNCYPLLMFRLTCT